MSANRQHYEKHTAEITDTQLRLLDKSATSVVVYIHPTKRAGVWRGRISSVNLLFNIVGLCVLAGCSIQTTIKGQPGKRYAAIAGSDSGPDSLTQTDVRGYMQASADPATCTVGEHYHNIRTKLFRYCSATNVWSDSRVVSVRDYGAVGDGLTNDAPAIQAAINAAPAGGYLTFPATSRAYKINSQISIRNKPHLRIDFNNVLIDASGIGKTNTAIYIIGFSYGQIDHLRIDGGNNCGTGIKFDARNPSITVYAQIGTVMVSRCGLGAMIGPDDKVSQFDEAMISFIFADRCATGVKVQGVNTLGLRLDTVAANAQGIQSSIGVHLEGGSGTIRTLLSAGNTTDLYIGPTDGLNGNRLSIWSILGGYFEMSTAGERWIDSAQAADTHPFVESLQIENVRITPFSSTNTPDFIRWRVNGDLRIHNSTIIHGQLDPYVLIDHNAARTAPHVTLDNLYVEASPSSSPQRGLIVRQVSRASTWALRARVNNQYTLWTSNGTGVMNHIDTDKTKAFQTTLLSIGNLLSAWHLRDMSTGAVKNILPGKPLLTLSTSFHTRNMELNDGLVGFFQSGNTPPEPTLSNSATGVFDAKAEYTFGVITATQVAGVVFPAIRLGGPGGMYLRLGESGKGFAEMIAGSAMVSSTLLAVNRPICIIGRYQSATSLTLDTMNLITGEKTTSKNIERCPPFRSMSWTDGFEMFSWYGPRAFPFVYDRRLTDAEVATIMQSALSLVDQINLQ